MLQVRVNGSAKQLKNQKKAAKNFKDPTLHRPIQLDRNKISIARKKTGKSLKQIIKNLL